MSESNIDKHKILTLIPAFNEAKNISATIKSLNSSGIDQQIVVIDDGSTDDTYSIAAKTGVTVLKNSKNLGKGDSINVALREYKDDFKYVLLVDADIGDSAREAVKLLEPVLSGEADMAIGKLPPSKKSGGFGFVRWLAEKSVYAKSGKKITCSLSGQRAIKISSLDGIKIGKGFGLEVALTINFLNAGHTIKEVEVDMKHTGTGKSIGGFAHRGKQFYQILKTVWIGR